MARFALILVVVALAPAAQAAKTVNPSLYFKYAMNCTFAVTDDSGKTVSSPLPGTYSVVVTSPESFAGVDLSGSNDMTACKGSVQFQLSGPGVNVETTLDNGDGEFDLQTAVFKASSTYTAVDNNQPSVARLSFTTQASGTAAQVANPSSGGSGKGKAEESTSIVGSANASKTFRGAVAATVSAAGKLTLTRSGKPVTSLKSGRYAFTVGDHSKTRGFSIKSLHGKAIPLTTSAFTGARKVTVGLAAGRWYFFSPGGVQSQFFVLS